MTQLRARCKCGASNELDTLEQGIGHRGSSFMDFDAVSHDIRTHRFLNREIKRPGEALNPAARLTLIDLALEVRWTVWYVQLMFAHDRLAWADMRLPDSIDVITPEQYRERLKAWWADRYRLEDYAVITTELPRRRA